jgi:hypothetical protein
MSLTVLTAANSRRLTTQEAVYQDTRDVRVLEQPTLMEQLIDQASAAIERYCWRIFAQQRYLEVIPGIPSAFVPLRYATIVSVASVLIDTTAVTDYRIEDADAGLLFRRWGWGSPYIDVTAEYIAGWILPEQTSTPAPSGPLLPADVERAAIESVKVWFKELNPSDRIEARQIGDQRIDYGVQARRQAIPVLAEDLLAGWRRVALR